MAARKHIELPLWMPRKLGDNELGTVRLLDIHMVCERISFSRAQVYEMMADGRFPRPIKFAPGRRGAVRWPDIWVSDWLQIVTEHACAIEAGDWSGASGPPSPSNAAPLPSTHSPGSTMTP